MIVYAYSYIDSLAAGESGYCKMRLKDSTTNTILTDYFSSSSNKSFTFEIKKGHTYSYDIDCAKYNAEGNSGGSGKYHYGATATVFYVD